MITGLVTRYYKPSNLEEYEGILGRHDWFWYMSDTNYSSEPSDELVALAKHNGKAWKQAYNEAHALRFNTASFVTEDRPYTKPFPEC
jgi:hypothetical protein